MLTILSRLYQRLKTSIKQMQIKHTNSLMSVYLQLELPFTMASESPYLPLRIAQLTRAAKTRNYKKGMNHG